MIDSRENGYPRGWRTLSLAIPRGLSDDIAAYIGRAVGTVRRWREPALNGSGEPSFLDMLYAVSSALHHYHKPGLRKLENDISAWFRRLDSQEVASVNHTQAAVEVTKEAAEVVLSFLQGATPADQEKELLDLIATANEHLARLRAQRRITEFAAKPVRL